MSADVRCRQGSRSVSGSRSKRLLVPGGVHSGDPQDRPITGAQPRHDAVPVARRDDQEHSRRPVAAVRVPETARSRRQALREAHRLAVLRQSQVLRLGGRKQVRIRHLCLRLC